MQGEFGYFVKMERPTGPVDPGWGVIPPVDPGWGVGKPLPPHGPLPSLPGIWPPPDKPSFPIIWPIPPETGGPPVVIPQPPDKPLPGPPGTIWPPLPPDAGISGKVAILVWVVSVGYRWFIYEAPPAAGPK